jgi:hypothetical protein
MLVRIDRFRNRYGPVGIVGENVSVRTFFPGAVSDRCWQTRREGS